MSAEHPRQPSDPDAQGLPPGVELPPAGPYRRDQLWALVVTNAVGLVIVAALWKLAPQYPRALVVCTFFVALFFVINLMRWLAAR
jgi:hypothetical protein